MKHTTVHTIKTFIQRRPLLFVMLAAGAVRLMAVIWSKGFIHNDDHFETVVISQDWLTSGLFGPDGLLHWLTQPASDITRFPLYTLFVYAIMKVESWLGIQSLDAMMYGVRLGHALISLLPVVFIFKTVKLVTRDDRWAVIGGLFAGLYFAAPFLGVRNLIEVVGGEIWLVALYGFYQYAHDKKARWLYFAGLLTGLAWMIRFQIAFAALPIPLVLWYEYRNLRPAIHYCVATGLMILLAWTCDWIFLGRFAGSSLVNFNPRALYDTIYNTIPGMYIVVLLGLFIPPMSLVLVWLAGRPSFVRKHRLLIFSTLSFVVFHWFLRNQQERFLFPILPASIL
ncbi:MAG: glycosyltransferase family 39 protein, partial [candidate division Zixibacteria bacterium]|nr:glycosyltransferase family 39 protein [candidate division Zixibacteria bacterium]